MTWTLGWRYAGLGTGDRTPALGPAVLPSGGIATVADDEAVRQSVMLLLSTIPGERVMRPDYGCPLHRIVFSPMDETTAGLAIHYVRQALLRFEPRIEILRLDAGPTPEAGGVAEPGQDNRLYVRLEYRVRASRRTGQVVLGVDLSGENG